MSILLSILTMINLGLIGWYMIDSRRLYNFTMLFSASFAGWVIPQLIGLSNETGTLFMGLLPEGALEIITLMSILCLVATWLGDNYGLSHPGFGAIHRLAEYDYARLVRVAMGLTVVGVIIVQIAHNVLSKQYLDNLGTQWTGPITILAFFQSMQKYGFALAVLLYFRTRSPAALMCALFGVVSSVVAFTISARRGAAADTVFMVILGLYFGRRVILPAWVMGTIFVFGALMVNNIGHFRGGKEDASFIERLQSADLFGMFNYTLTNGGYELANAAINAWCAEQSEGEFDFGKVHWNQLVHAYFPGQIFGHELKKALKFEERDLAREMLNYKPPPGTTQTGMSDAFMSFWYLGALKFYLIGYVMGRWMNRANRGDLKSQLAYMALMSPALHTITHGTYWLLNHYIHMVIFAYPALYWARASQPEPAPLTFEPALRP